MFTERWDESKQQIGLPELTVGGFGIVLDWLYTGRLPDVTEYWSTGGSTAIIDAYAAVEFLILDEMQNDLIKNEADKLLRHGLGYRCGRLSSPHKSALSHTRYYQFVLKRIMECFMSENGMKSRECDHNVKQVKDHPEISLDLLTNIRKWASKPWKHCLKGDLSKFFVNAPQTADDSTTSRSNG